MYLYACYFRLRSTTSDKERKRSEELYQVGLTPLIKVKCSQTVLLDAVLVYCLWQVYTYGHNRTGIGYTIAKS